ncbi:hypothetical protein NST84_16615 [Paenibacillus sp. FSL R7-0345]|uniref:hypothetical protein n=1 Tax=Paenibacillus sp. FSL R7-0345 TaxID=2954535 RepID=UPI003159989D
MKKDDLNKFFCGWRFIAFALVLTPVLHLIAFLIGVMENLVKESYKIGYLFGSFLELMI